MTADVVASLSSLDDGVPHRVEVDPVGLNHLSWVRHIRVDGVDVLPGMIADRSDELGRRGGVSGGRASGFRS